MHRCSTNTAAPRVIFLLGAGQGWDKPSPFLTFAFPGSHQTRGRARRPSSFQQHSLCRVLQITFPAGTEQGVQGPKAQLSHSHTEAKSIPSKVWISFRLAFFQAHTLCISKAKYQSVELHCIHKKTHGRTDKQGCKVISINIATGPIKDDVGRIFHLLGNQTSSLLFFYRNCNGKTHHRITGPL